MESASAVLQRLRANRDLWPILPYVGFLVARVFKTDPRLSILPIDLTLALAAVTLVAVAVRLRFVRFDWRIALLIALFSSFLVAAFWMETTDYATAKIVQLLSLNALAALAPFAILRTERERRAFVNILLSAAIVLAVDVALRVLGFMGPVDPRIAGFEGQSIWSARLAGAGLVIVLSKMFNATIRLGWGSALAALLALALAASGSRGPALAAAIGTVLALTYSVVRIGVRPSRLSVLPLAAAVIGVFILQLVPTSNIDRLTTLLEAEPLKSGEIRTDIASAAIEASLRHPMGTGWGTFHTVADLPGYSQDEGLYPHNLFLEVAVEAGWLSVALLVASVSIGLLALWSHAPRAGSTAAIIGLFGLYLVAAQFSGDVNANRLLFAFIGIGLATVARNRTSNGSHPVQHPQERAAW